jgi:hypothetical protein
LKGLFFFSYKKREQKRGKKKNLSVGNLPGEIGGTNVGGTKQTFVPPILNVTPIHGYFFTGEETGSTDRDRCLTFLVSTILVD